LTHTLLGVMFGIVIMDLESIHRGYETDIHISMSLLLLVQMVLGYSYSPVFVDISGFFLPLHRCLLLQICHHL